MPSVFEELDAFKWRDVEVPVSQMRVTVAQELVEHKYWGVNGARIEATGRQPLHIHATIPFRNGIVKGKKESWTALYPTQLRRFLLAMEDRSHGVLTHPELGQIACKPASVDISWSPDKRDGCDVEAAWTETMIVGDQSPFADKSPVKTAEAAAETLDKDKVLLKELVAKQLAEQGLALPVYKDSFESMMNSLSGKFDKASMGTKRFLGRIDAIEYRVKTLGAAIGRAGNALTWPATDAIERMKSAVNAARKGAATASGRELRLYRVPSDTTMAGVFSRLPAGTSLAELMRLNPTLSRTPKVKAGSIVRYFRSKIG